MNHLRGLLLCLAVGLVSIACGSSRAHQALDTQAFVIGPEVASADAVEVGMYEYGIDASTAGRGAGRIDFVATNKGHEEHEFAIVPRDGERYGLPLTELEDLKPGESRAVRMTLGPGKYSLVCLVVALRGVQPQPHMALGMETSFEVTE